VYVIRWGDWGHMAFFSSLFRLDWVLESWIFYKYGGWGAGVLYFIFIKLLFVGCEGRKDHEFSFKLFWFLKSSTEK
jgi:hypothetical protein